MTYRGQHSTYYKGNCSRDGAQKKLENDPDNRAIIFPERVTTQNYRMYETL